MENIKLIRKLGNGAYGEVYLANHELLNRTDAVKIIEVKNPTEFKEHLEARILLKCKHDNVVVIHDVDIVEINNKFHVSISMEYMDSGSLLDCLKKSPLSFKESLSICIKVLFALENAHQNDVLHRDVKPENIMIDTNSGAKLSDFGVAAIIDESGEGSAKGSPVFRVPETFSEEITNFQTEVFSVGMSLYQMISHILDWNILIEDYEIITNGKTIKTIGYPAFVPKKLKRIINIACNFDPAKRYQSAKNLRQALERLQVKIDWRYIPERITWLGICSKKKNHEMKIVQKMKHYENEYKINNRRQNNKCTQHKTLEDVKSDQYSIIQETTFS